MKLGSLKSKTSIDGELVLVSHDLKKMAKAGDIAPNLLVALERWDQVLPALKKRDQELNQGIFSEALPYDEKEMAAALPRTWLFADGSAFIHHIKLVRLARKAALPETLLTVPLMYQAESARFLDPLEDIPQRDFAHGSDFEAEVGVITDFVPMGTSAQEALQKIRLIILINDVSLRGLIPEELAQGFGFFQSKPASSLSPIAVTPDELGEAWRDGRVHLPLNVKYKGEFFGRANAGEMHFHFGELIAHAAKTRSLVAGTLIGSGTVANSLVSEDPSIGSSCLAEKRTLEQLGQGKISTPFMKVGDTVEIWMNDLDGASIFGRIYQQVACH
ncbi:MAG: fumarylacetoacetate hydrolase family protein [Bdellovibrionaceae bacterium]|nr:fumarylacetoacetate hydrolase family protein [Pseudobdellovibrionaceae bacterium]